MANKKSKKIFIEESTNINKLIETRGGNLQNINKPPISAADELSNYINNLPKKKK